MFNPIVTVRKRQKGDLRACVTPSQAIPHALQGNVTMGPRRSQVLEQSLPMPSQSIAAILVARLSFQ